MQSHQHSIRMYRQDRQNKGPRRCEMRQVGILFMIEKRNIKTGLYSVAIGVKNIGTTLRMKLNYKAYRVNSPILESIKQAPDTSSTL